VVRRQPDGSFAAVAWEHALHDTVIVASSEPEELVALCDRVVCIRQGRVAGVLENAEITEREITRVIS
jgi:ABC-type sugar transport system ATPase subunit